MSDAYLEGELRDRFDAWLAATLARYSPPLVYTELRKGVRALSSLYLERRGEGRVAERAFEGEGKRAAFASYYAALHFLCAHQLARSLGNSKLGQVEQIFDLGCGTGAAGAAVATALGPALRVLGIDRSGWALKEARLTYRAFGLRGRTRRASLPRGMPRPAPHRLLLLGWSANELDDGSRDLLLERLRRHAESGGLLLVLEPLAGSVSPWWESWRRALAAAGVAEGEFKRAVERPAWIQQMDKSAQLDHRILGARWLAGP